METSEKKHIQIHSSPLESEAVSMEKSGELADEVASPPSSSTPSSKANKVNNIKGSVDRGRVKSAIDAAHKQAIAARVQRECLTWRRCSTCSVSFGLASTALAILSLTPSWFTFKNYTLYLWSAPVPLVGTFSGDGIYSVAVAGIAFDVLATLVPLYLRIRILRGYKPPIELTLDSRPEGGEEDEEEKEAAVKFASSSVYFTKIALSLRFLSFLLTVFVVAAMEARYRTGWTTKEEGWRRMVASICMSVIAFICLLPMTSLSLYGPDVSLLPQNVLLKEDEPPVVSIDSLKQPASSSTSSESYEEVDTDISVSIGSSPAKPSAMRRPDHLSLHQRRPSTADNVPPPTLLLPSDSHNFDEDNNSRGSKHMIPPPPPPSLSPISQTQLPKTPPASPLRNASSPLRSSIPNFNRSRDSPSAVSVGRGAGSTAASPSASARRGKDSSVTGSTREDSISSSPRSVEITFSRLKTKESPKAGTTL